MAMKKGLFFTVTAVVLLLALSVMIYFQTRYVSSDDTVTDARISSMNDFAENIEDDLQRGLYISSFRAVLSMESYVSEGGVFLNSSSSAFDEAFLNGTINSEQMPLMQDSTLNDWSSRIKSQALQLGIIANISVDGVGIVQYDSWTLLVTSNITINITDTLYTASWILNESPSSFISVVGFEDPVFSVNTQNKVVRVINSTQFEGIYTSGNDTANLVKHIDAHYYTNSTGPSFLMRLEGNLSNSSFGIESFVNVPELQINGVPQYQRSMVDYVYFGNLSTDGLYSVNGTYESWFILDKSHLAKYQVTASSEPWTG